jgi:hypothetical protein
VVDNNGYVWFWDGSAFQKVAPSPFAGSTAAFDICISVGPSTAPNAGPNGDVWIATSYRLPAGLYELQNGTEWVSESTPGYSVGCVAVSPDYGVPWLPLTVGTSV